MIAGGAKVASHLEGGGLFGHLTQCSDIEPTSLFDGGSFSRYCWRLGLIKRLGSSFPKRLWSCTPFWAWVVMICIMRFGHGPL